MEISANLHQPTCLRLTGIEAKSNHKRKFRRFSQASYCQRTSDFFDFQPFQCSPLGSLKTVEISPTQTTVKAAFKGEEKGLWKCDG